MWCWMRNEREGFIKAVLESQRGTPHTYARGEWVP